MKHGGLSASRGESPLRLGASFCARFRAEDLRARGGRGGKRGRAKRGGGEGSSEGGLGGIYAREQSRKNGGANENDGGRQQRKTLVKERKDPSGEGKLDQSPSKNGESPVPGVDGGCHPRHSQRERQKDEGFERGLLRLSRGYRRENISELSEGFH